MSGSESRSEVIIKPLLIKAGIPAVLSVAAYIYARIISKRSSNLETSFDLSNQHCSDSTSSSECEEEEEVAEVGNLEDKLTELENQLEELQRKEWDLEMRFLRYCNMKEKECMLMEIKKMKLLQKTRAEALLREISIMEEENQRVGEMISEYMKAVNQIDELKKENELLQRKARKQWRRAKQRVRIIREQKLSIEAKDGEVLSSQRELERRCNLMEELENEVSQLKEVVDHLKRENSELYNKREELAEKSGPSNQEIESIEGVTKEEYEEVLKELEKLKKDREVEAKELAYLKWSNSCLRHELLRHHEQRDQTKDEFKNQNFKIEPEGGNEYEDEDGNNNIKHEEHEACKCTGQMVSYDHHHVQSRRKRLMKKLKKWVDGGKIDEKEKNEIKCFGGGHSVSEETEDQFVYARKSCSSI